MQRTRSTHAACGTGGRRAAGGTPCSRAARAECSPPGMRVTRAAAAPPLRAFLRRPLARRGWREGCGACARPTW
eukprot:scaffold63892_cov75-Phaeocystis_antarctica.AAC.4